MLHLIRILKDCKPMFQTISVISCVLTLQTRFVVDANKFGTAQSSTKDLIGLNTKKPVKALKLNLRKILNKKIVCKKILQQQTKTYRTRRKVLNISKRSR